MIRGQIVKVFGKLRKIGKSERRYLPLLQTLEDIEIVREIGYHQEAGIPLALKHLLEMKIASDATMNRRVKRLKELGLVRQRPSRTDGRVGLLRLSPAVLRAYARVGHLLHAG